MNNPNFNGAIDFNNRLRILEMQFKSFFKVPNPKAAEEELDVENHAAVLILLEWKANDWYVLLTERSKTLRKHAGEVAFPGGMADRTDASPVETALRETEEEVGIPKSMIRVLGTLPPFITKYGYPYYPVIAVIRDGVTVMPMNNVKEVAKSFWLPLRRFLTANNYKVRQITEYFRTHWFIDRVDDYEVVTWGITAYVMVIVSIIVYGQMPVFLKFTDSVNQSWKTIINRVFNKAMDPTFAVDRLAKL